MPLPLPVRAALDPIAHAAPLGVAGLDALAEPPVMAFEVDCAVRAIGPVGFAIVADSELLKNERTMLASAGKMRGYVVHVHHHGLRVAPHGTRAAVVRSCGRVADHDD